MRLRFALLAALVGVVLLASTVDAAAAGEVVVTASPSDARVGQPVEIMVRTFVPFARSTLGLPSPREPYPANATAWNVLYPWDDYPFDVEARVGDGSSVRIGVARDPTDATLWRGTFTPPKSGTWTVRVLNFPAGTPGASAIVGASTGDPIETSPVSLGVAALVGLAIGSLGGLVAGRRSAHGPR